jgi:dihydroorotate dehydrogenase (NAD+) catalytic subunit
MDAPNSMTVSAELPRYNPHQSYSWNYEHAPAPQQTDVPQIPGSWDFCGLPVASPLGVAAGPLLNGKWLLYYASLGFDVLTYKTVRSAERACYPLPNLLPVQTGYLKGGEERIPEAGESTGSWAVSFGMPSRSPDAWRADIAATRRQLPKEKLLSVSVVGSVQPDWTMEDLAADYAQCARWAAESGADCVESNFSCPNVSTCDGQLYQQPDAAARTAQCVREALDQVAKSGRDGRRIPYIIKIGHLGSAQEAAALIEAVSPYADALAMTNSVATTVADGQGKLLFDGQRRGICGKAIFRASLEQTALVAGQLRERNLDLKLIGVGGASTALEVQCYLKAGAHAVHLATAPMLQPDVAIDIRSEWK